MDQFNQKTLRQFRKLLYPAIAQGIITGYNVYNEPKDPSDTAIHYLHSDLGIDENGKMDRHLESLIYTINNNFPNTLTTNIASAITDRIAIYQWGDWKENPLTTRLYDAHGNRLRDKDADDYEGVIIIEGRQYDLSMTPENWRQRTEIIRILLRYTQLKTLTSRCLLTPIENPRALIGSWAIPLIVSNQYSNLMKKVNEVRIQIETCQSRIVVRTPENLISYLNGKSLPATTSAIYVNTSFHNNYLIRK